MYWDVITFKLIKKLKNKKTYKLKVLEYFMGMIYETAKQTGKLVGYGVGQIFGGVFAGARSVFGVLDKRTKKTLLAGTLALVGIAAGLYSIGKITWGKPKETARLEDIAGNIIAVKREPDMKTNTYDPIKSYFTLVYEKGTRTNRYSSVPQRFGTDNEPELVVAHSIWTDEEKGKVNGLYSKIKEGTRIKVKDIAMPTDKTKV